MTVLTPVLHPGVDRDARSDIAEAADVSRRVVYQHFGDRDTLLLEAGLGLARRELLPPRGRRRGRADVNGRWRWPGSSPNTGSSTAPS
ncbi:TetR family transcriptional regulator [Streptomyces sp. NPDC057474]|uniref:TetR family transcriptional regulator n=1 Tax=Streptomyces sp. NPDC057474 TaxID=3346144 RepID=UPI003687458B